MPTPTATAEYLKLSVSERIQLVEDIWDSIANEASNSVELSPAQIAELHRRLEAGGQVLHYDISMRQAVATKMQSRGNTRQ